MLSLFSFLCVYGKLAGFLSDRWSALDYCGSPTLLQLNGSPQGSCFVVNHRKFGLRLLPAAVPSAGMAPEAGERQSSNRVVQLLRPRQQHKAKNQVFKIEQIFSVVFFL